MMIQFFVIVLREIAVSRVKSVYNDAEMCFYSTRRVGYKLFCISWQLFEQMPDAAGTTYADEHRYMLQAVPL